jgi:tetratricopeptide (TPR) repeat protein
VRALVQRHHGARSREMATLWHNLGGLAHARGNYVRGEPLARRAVEVGRRVLPAGHPELLAHEVAHAALLDGLERYRESIRIYRRALAAYTRIFGRAHYETASTLHNLAGAYASTGEGARAETAYRECIALYRRLLGPAHPDLGLARHNLGVVYAEAGRTRDARRELAAALAILRRSLGARHPHTRATQQSIVSLP